VIVSIFGLILQDDDIRQEVVETVVRGLPVTAAGRRDVENALATIATPASAAGLISLVLFAWTASRMMRAIRQGLETAMQVVETRSMSRGKLVDALLVAGAGALILVSVTITVLGDLLRGVLGDRIGDVGRTDTLVGGASRAVAIAVSIGVVLLLYRFVPARGLRVRDGLVGAIVTAVLLQLISLASGWIAVRTSKLSFIYGSLTAALFFVYSIYLYSAALLFGAEVASMWAHPLEAPITPLRRRMTVSALKTALREARRLT